MCALALVACGPSEGPPRGEENTTPVEASASEPPAPQPEDPPPTVGQLDLGTLSDGAHTARSVRAFVPPGPGPWPVLFVLDGHAESTLRVRHAMGRLLNEQAIAPWAVVLVPSGANRRAELANHAEAMGDFLVETVLPALEEHVAVSPEAGDRAVLGYSYGGLAALRIALHRREIGRACAMSPSLWWRARRLTEEWDAERAPERLWIDVGTAEPDRGETIPYMVLDARNLRDAAIEGGMRLGDDLGYYEAPGESHAFNAAGRRMQTALAFVLSNVDLSERRPDSVSVFLLPTTARWQSFAVEARYGEHLRLTWPPAEVRLEVRGDARPRRGDLVHTLGDSRLVATLHGVRSGS